MDRAAPRAPQGRAHPTPRQDLTAPQGRKDQADPRAPQGRAGLAGLAGLAGHGDPAGSGSSRASPA
ncbi:hypothetical protein SAMN05216252_10486 [Actinacidiphila glaucinigra]|uniref:Uncharacterized protein n=1 Tax=Actinacidiphila glaucinigra TaxID=235986 RepID=A0A239CLY4_9ACTN|nr:hypothetical protein SAMN05216252_10486 [Actinacidiphila glaucinigra]